MIATRATHGIGFPDLHRCVWSDRTNTISEEGVVLSAFVVDALDIVRADFDAWGCR